MLAKPLTPLTVRQHLIVVLLLEAFRCNRQLELLQLLRTLDAAVPKCFTLPAAMPRPKRCSGRLQ